VATDCWRASPSANTVIDAGRVGIAHPPHQHQTPRISRRSLDIHPLGDDDFMGRIVDDGRPGRRHAEGAERIPLVRQDADVVASRRGIAVAEGQATAFAVTDRVGDGRSKVVARSAARSTSTAGKQVSTA